ncbi:CD3324 family protein [Paenibacillus lautus]|uniref:CD3324 family protein n=1 Tax=Paenibacillus lautus TaxID=1401 RepID=UPI003D26962F
MKYEKALDILPEHVIKTIQQYIDGSYIYIPRKLENRKSWGEQTGVKKDLDIRNQNIFKCYMHGDSIRTLSERYYLTEQSIRRIIRAERMKE